MQRLNTSDMFSAEKLIAGEANAIFYYFLVQRLLFEIVVAYVGASGPPCSDDRSGKMLKTIISSTMHLFLSKMKIGCCCGDRHSDGCSTGLWGR